MQGEGNLVIVRKSQLIAVLQKRFIAEGMDDATALEAALICAETMIKGAQERPYKPSFPGSG